MGFGVGVEVAAGFPLSEEAGYVSDVVHGAAFGVDSGSLLRAAPAFDLGVGRHSGPGVRFDCCGFSRLGSVLLAAPVRAAWQKHSLDLDDVTPIPSLRLPDKYRDLRGKTLG